MKNKDPNRLPHILVIGFPKSGTSTINRALSASGLVSAHWVWNDVPIGKLIYDGWYDHGDPLALLTGVDAITQMDFCHPETGRNYWPNLDIALLLAIRRLHPDVLFILNDRPRNAVADSFARWDAWEPFVPRVAAADITGLPAGRGTTQDELVRWFECHTNAIRDIFEFDPQFLDLDITADDARKKLAAFIGRPIRWWGVANANPTESTETGT